MERGGVVPELNVTANEASVISSLGVVYTAASGSGNDWKDAKILLTDIDSIRSGILITKLADKFYVLRITSTGDVQIGLESKLDDAIKQSEKPESFDPRKLVWQFATTAEKNGINDNGLKVNVNNEQKEIKETYDRVILVWSGRVGNTKYDDFKYALNGKSSYKTLSDFKRVDYKDLNLNNTIKPKEQETLEPAKIDGAPTAHFYIEDKKNSKGGRRAWAYVTSYMTPEKGANQVSYPHNVRYGDSEGVDADDLYLSGYTATATNKGKKMITASQANSDNGASSFDTRAPSGKAVLVRGIGSGNSSLFFSTVVGYNLRMKEFSGNADDFKDSNGKPIDKNRLKNVIAEFDESTFLDAQADGWDGIYDFPKYKDEKSIELENGGKRETYKVPFVFIKGE